VNRLFDGREYIKLYTALDLNGNKVAKVFFANGIIEMIKDARLPLSGDKFYKSLSGLRQSK
jgi:hypothetical protein